MAKKRYTKDSIHQAIALQMIPWFNVFKFLDLFAMKNRKEEINPRIKPMVMIVINKTMA